MCVTQEIMEYCIKYTSPKDESKPDQAPVAYVFKE